MLAREARVYSSYRYTLAATHTKAFPGIWVKSLVTTIVKHSLDGVFIYFSLPIEKN